LAICGWLVAVGTGIGFVIRPPIWLWHEGKRQSGTPFTQNS
jgi:hypothetical protein